MQAGMRNDQAACNLQFSDLAMSTGYSSGYMLSKDSTCIL